MKAIASNYQQLSDMAKLITNELISLLQKHDGQLRNQWRNSVYGHEVTYQEYFMWWYHLFYNAVTDWLIAKGEITKPRTGVLTYLMTP
jgi:siroheme synthase (precorrin-2 oxidase/ferrochelatase)